MRNPAAFTLNQLKVTGYPLPDRVGDKLRGYDEYPSRVLKNYLRCHNCVKNRLTCLRPNAAGGPEGVSEANQMLIYDQ
jgi:hypothetical protein